MATSYASIVFGVIATILMSLLLAQFGQMSAFGFVGMGVVLYVAISILIQPKLWLIYLMAAGFFVIGATRYITGIPLGLSIDGLFAIGLIGAIVSWKWYRGFPKFKLHVGIALVWFLYTFLELFNPEAVSSQAWFYAVRGVSFYMLAAFILLSFFKFTTKDFYRYVHIVVGLAALGALWALKQKFVGLDSAEQAWLNNGGAITHLLRGKLRHFSFFSDAGQFGALMGALSVIAGIVGIYYKSYKMKLFWWILAGLFFYGLLISGTRGAFFVIAGGGFGFLLLQRNIKLIVIALIGGFLAFGFLKFTSIGNSNYDIARMRSALNPEDASLQVRLENQKILAAYLSNRPFGGGIGAGGGWGQRFSPNSYLAQIELDSWYVKIWAETGIVGLLLHIACLLSFLIYGFIQIRKLTNDQLKIYMTAIWCATLGVILASYGNQIFGQAPISLIMYANIHFLFIAKSFNQNLHEQSEE